MNDDFVPRKKPSVSDRMRTILVWVVLLLVILQLWGIALHGSACRVAGHD